MCKTSSTMISSKKLNPQAKEWHPPPRHKPHPPPYLPPPQTSWFLVPHQIYKKHHNSSCFFGQYNIHTAIPLIYPSPRLCRYSTHHQPQSPRYAHSQWPPLHPPSAVAGGGRLDVKTSPSLANKRSPKGLRRSDTHHPSRCEWKRKNNNMSKSSGSGSVVADRHESSSPPPQKCGGRTTIMIRNIPNQYRRHMLLGFLDKLCHEQNQKAQNESDHPLRFQYDFVYLPIDFGSGDNYGYAFVNFTSAIASARIGKLLAKYRWDVFEDSKGRLCRSKKICEITWARIQGKEDLVKHFRNSHFVCNEEYLPVAFSPPRDGAVPTVPTPTPLGRCLASKT